MRYEGVSDSGNARRDTVERSGRIISDFIVKVVDRYGIPRVKIG